MSNPGEEEEGVANTGNETNEEGGATEGAGASHMDTPSDGGPHKEESTESH